jgi:hypothetical protein
MKIHQVPARQDFYAFRKVSKMNPYFDKTAPARCRHRAFAINALICYLDEEAEERLLLGKLH